MCQAAFFIKPNPMTPPKEVARRFAARFKATLPEYDEQRLASIMTYCTADKGDTILAEGRISHNMLFVERGLIRQYYYKNGYDITEHFCCEEDVVYCTESMLMQTPTDLMIEAEEDCSYYEIPFKRFMELCEVSTPIMKLYCRILEDGLLESLRKTDAQRFESARERYENFVRQYPEAAKRASGKHIASYLLMTPESLCRIKAEIVKQK